MSKDFLLSAFNALSDEDFEERPVEIEEFVTSAEFLGIPPLSELQYSIVKASSQIYRLETLVSLYGEQKGAQRYKETYNEIILQIGKGAGKDWTMSVAMCYIVYLLLCLRSPSAYYGQAEGNHIDLINVAINADQAKNVFFKYMQERLRGSPWFAGKYKEGNNSIEFDKNITLYSGHSEREAFEGLNLFMAVLDEISGFALESNTGNLRANTAQATYDTYRDSVDSRFEEFGKVSMLSFPRFEDDFIQKKYKEAISEKETILRSHTFIIDEDYPHDDPDNTITIEWEEDHIIRYRAPRTYCLRRPSWDVRPDRDIDSYKLNFFRNMGNALGKFACMPSNLESGFFKNKEAIASTFVLPNGVDNSDGTFDRDFKAKPKTKYYLHVDLAQKHDYCAVAMSHVEKWVDIDEGNPTGEPYPYVVVDLVRYWKPTKDKSIDFKDVRNFIVSLKRRGFDIEICTFDRWQSHDTMKYLSEQQGIETELLSVALKHYQDFQTVLYDGRMEGPQVPDPDDPDKDLLKKELGELRIVRDKIDHPASGYKDLSDATCGSVYNAIVYSEKPQDEEVEVLTLRDVRAKVRAEEAETYDDGVIRAPKSYRPMPDDLAGYLDGLRML